MRGEQRLDHSVVSWNFPEICPMAEAMKSDATDIWRPSPVLALLLLGALVLGGASTGAEAEAGSACQPATGKFVVKGPQICDPEGNPWIPRGVNITGANGLKWFPSAHGYADYYKNVWNLNAIRLNYCEVCESHKPGSYHFGELVDLVQEYTSRKMVVLVDNHEGRNGDPEGQSRAEIDWAKQFFRGLAIQYKDNPYVWFELFNEPLEEGSGNKTPIPHWRDIHDEVAGAIRAAGSENIIVMNASHFGQDRYRNEVGGFRPSESSILTFGPDLRNKYGNLVFDVHIYSRWMEANEGLQEYFDAVHNAGLAILVGETGGNAASSAKIRRQDWAATANLYSLKPQGVGIFNWFTYDSRDEKKKRLVIAGENSVMHSEWTHNPPSSVVPVQKSGSSGGSSSAFGCSVAYGRF